jgi:hypothetical protein
VRLIQNKCARLPVGCLARVDLGLEGLLPAGVGIELGLGRRRGDGVVEADWSGWTAEFDEVEVPGGLRHRAPLFALGADVEGAGWLARERGVVVARPARDSCAGEVRDACVDVGADAVRDGEPVDEDDAAPLVERERPRRAAGVELERPRRLEPGGGCLCLSPTVGCDRLSRYKEQRSCERAGIDVGTAGAHGRNTCKLAGRVP